jgi:hypothetical protein
VGIDNGFFIKMRFSSPLKSECQVINEAVLYLSHAPKEVKKIIILREVHRPQRNDSLAEYYVKTYFHLLNEISVMEFDIDRMILKDIKHGSV